MIFLAISISSLSLYSEGAFFCSLSKINDISARFRAALLEVPENITSSISLLRICFADVSPITHRSASTMFDLPHPFGPTIPVRPGSISSSAVSAKDLNPASLKWRNIIGLKLHLYNLKNYFLTQ